jgi:hypothetical protein
MDEIVYFFWCSRERLPAAAAQPAKVRQSCSATGGKKTVVYLTTECSSYSVI